MRSSVRTQKTMTGSNGAKEGRLKIYFKGARRGVSQLVATKKGALWHRAPGRLSLKWAERRSDENEPHSSYRTETRKCKYEPSLYGSGSESEKVIHEKIMKVVCGDFLRENLQIRWRAGVAPCVKVVINEFRRE